MESMEMSTVGTDAASPTPAILAVLRDPEARRVFDFFRRLWKGKLGPRRPDYELAYATNRVVKTEKVVSHSIRPGRAHTGDALPEANLHLVLLSSESRTCEERERLAAFHRRIDELLRKKAFRIIGARLEKEFRVQNDADPPPKFGEMCCVFAAYVSSSRVHPDIGPPSAFRHVLNLMGRGNIPFHWSRTTAHILVLAE